MHHKCLNVVCVVYRGQGQSNLRCCHLKVSVLPPPFLIKTGSPSDLELKEYTRMLAFQSPGTILVHIPSAGMTPMSSFYYWGLYSLHHLSYLPSFQMTSFLFSGEKYVFVCQGLGFSFHPVVWELNSDPAKSPLCISLGEDPPVR